MVSETEKNSRSVTDIIFKRKKIVQCRKQIQIEQEKEIKKNEKKIRFV